MGRTHFQSKKLHKLKIKNFCHNFSGCDFEIISLLSTKTTNTKQKQNKTHTQKKNKTKQEKNQINKQRKQKMNYTVL